MRNFPNALSSKIPAAEGADGSAARSTLFDENQFPRISTKLRGSIPRPYVNGRRSLSTGGRNLKKECPQPPPRPRPATEPLGCDSPILEPPRGVNTTAFTTYSRDYFSSEPNISFGFDPPSADERAAASFTTFTQAARFFGCPELGRAAERRPTGSDTDERANEEAARDADRLVNHGGSQRTSLFLRA